MNEEFHAQYAVRKAHLESVPKAVALAKSLVIDYDGSAMDDRGPPRDGADCRLLRTLVAEIERLQAQVLQLHKDAREEQREFQREARGIADEARWQERQSHDGDYGSF